jgi:hypothetical protein
MVTGIPPDAVQSGMTSLAEQIRAHLDVSVAPDATVGEVLGALEVEEAPLAVLPASLPGKILAVGSRTASLGDVDRHRVRLEILTSGGAVDVTYQAATAALFDRRITLTYNPATDDDAATVESFEGLYQTSSSRHRKRGPDGRTAPPACALLGATAPWRLCGAQSDHGQLRRRRARSSDGLGRRDADA